MVFDINVSNVFNVLLLLKESEKKMVHYYCFCFRIYTNILPDFIAMECGYCSGDSSDYVRGLLF